MAEQLPLDLRVSAKQKLRCDYCGDLVIVEETDGRRLGTGAAINMAGETVCYSCCAFADTIDMARTEPGDPLPVGLYVSGGELGEVSNWPSTLTMMVTARTAWGRGGFGSKRRTVYFKGPVIDGEPSWWSGVEYNGNAGNLLRKVRRLKR